MAKKVIIHELEYEVLDSDDDRIRLQRYDEKTKMLVRISFPRVADEIANERFLNSMVDMYISMYITKPFS